MILLNAYLTSMRAGSLSFEGVREVEGREVGGREEGVCAGRVEARVC